MENLKTHEGWKILEAWLIDELKQKDIDIVMAIRSGDISKAQILQATKEYVSELLNKPDMLIFDASQKTIWEQAIDLD